jgi:hypothetical protein
VPAPLARALVRLERHVPDAGVVVVAGLDDPRLLSALPPGPRVIVPALTRRAAPPWTAPLLASAAAIVLLDRSEAAGLPAAVTAPVVVTGVPRPEPPPRPGRGLDDGGHAALAALWRSEVGPPPADGPGVAWVGGVGGTPVAAAAEAWAAGRAVVALPGTACHDMLARGGALFARTSLEALEATRLLAAARPLAEALAARGRRELQGLETLDGVAARFAEAVVLATGGDDGR